MQRFFFANRFADALNDAGRSVSSSLTSRASAMRHVRVGRVSRHQLLLLLCVLAGCAVRAPRTDVVEPQADLSEVTVKRLISAWEQELTRYINREGGGDPAALSRTQALHSRDVPRPARITFGVLDVEPNVPGRDGWDVQGLLLGKQTSDTRNWYVFVVGIVPRDGYRPSSIRDIRLVAFSPLGKKLIWQMSPPDPQAARRYRDASPGSATVRFPADADRFSLHAIGDRVWVQEAESGASWALLLAGKDSGATSHASAAAHSSLGRASTGASP